MAETGVTLHPICVARLTFPVCSATIDGIKQFLQVKMGDFSIVAATAFLGGMVNTEWSRCLSFKAHHRAGPEFKT